MSPSAIFTLHFWPSAGRAPGDGRAVLAHRLCGPEARRLR